MILVRFGWMFLLITPSTMLSSVCIGVRSCLWTIYSIIFRMYKSSLALINRAPSSASAADNVTTLIICEIVSTAPLFGGNEELFGMNKFPPALMRAFVLFKYHASIFPDNFVSLFGKS